MSFIWSWLQFVHTHKKNCSHTQKITLKLVSRNTLVFKNIPCFREGKHTLVVGQEILPHTGRAVTHAGHGSCQAGFRACKAMGESPGFLPDPNALASCGLEKSAGFAFSCRRDALLPFPAATKSPTCRWLKRLP